MTKFNIRPGIKDAPLYIPGEHEIIDGVKPIILSANENPLGAGEKVIASYKNAGDNLFRYPDGSATKLRNAIATRFNLNVNNIICGAGSDELLTFITRIFAGLGDEIIYSQHGFLMYKINAMQVGATPISIAEKTLTTDVDAILNAINDKTKIIFIANPNNPTGSYISNNEMTRLANGLPDNVILVIDAAYAEYVSNADYSDGSKLVENHENIIMTRTFSKIFGLASLRLGWCYCSPVIADLINRIRGPFNVNASAQAAGIAAMEDTQHMEKSKKHNDYMLEKFGNQLKFLGLNVPKSVGNFLLAGFNDDKTAKQAYDYMLKNGIIARAMGGYGLPEYIRFTIGLEEECQQAITILQQFMKK